MRPLRGGMGEGRVGDRPDCSRNSREGADPGGSAAEAPPPPTPHDQPQEAQHPSPLIITSWASVSTSET